MFSCMMGLQKINRPHGGGLADYDLKFSRRLILCSFVPAICALPHISEAMFVARKLSGAISGMLWWRDRSRPAGEAGSIRPGDDAGADTSARFKMCGINGLRVTWF